MDDHTKDKKILTVCFMEKNKNQSCSIFKIPNIDEVLMGFAWCYTIYTQQKGSRRAERHIIRRVWQNIF